MRDVLSLADLKLIEKAEKITGTSYDIDKYNVAEELMYVIDDLITECEKIKEAYDDLETDLQENYRPLSASILNGVNDRDFI